MIFKLLNKVKQSAKCRGSRLRDGNNIRLRFIRINTRLAKCRGSRLRDGNSLSMPPLLSMWCWAKCRGSRLRDGNTPSVAFTNEALSG